MASLTVTMKGQVTLKRELLQHLGIKRESGLHWTSCQAANCVFGPNVLREASQLSSDAMPAR